MTDGPDLFSGGGTASGVRPPLAVRMRPRTLAQVRGQRDILRPGSPLRRLIDHEAIPSGGGEVRLSTEVNAGQQQTAIACRQFRGGDVMQWQVPQSVAVRVQS